MRPVRVADPDDPRVALYRGVRDPELLRDHGVFLAEGRLVVQRLLATSSFAVQSVLVTPSAFAPLESLLTAAPCDVLVAEQAVIDAVSGFNIHRGCLAIAARRTTHTLEALLDTRGPLVVLESVGNPDNVGGVFRNAAAFGASGVVLSPGCSDPLYRKAVRTSMGTALTVPFVTVTDWPGPLALLVGAGWQVVALSTAEAAEISKVAAGLRGLKMALLLGHEGAGLTGEARRLATIAARIPMVEGTDSLNVATAAAIALYEVTKRP